MESKTHQRCSQNLVVMACVVASAQAIILTPKTQFLPKYVILKLSFAVYLSPVDDVYTYQDLRTMLVLCEREVGGRTAMQCDRLVMVLQTGAGA